MVDLPASKKSIGLKWVFKTKYNVDNTIQKFKARLVVKGYSQSHGIDFDEIISLIARLETLRVFLTLAAQYRWPVFQLHIKSTILNSDLLEEMHITQLEGYMSQRSENKVYKLKKTFCSKGL